jgi:hypothetical protein
MKEKFPQMEVITHVEQAKDMFQTRVRFSKMFGATTAEVQA